MQRLTAIFIVICMVLISGALAAALYLGAGLNSTEAAVAGLAVLSALAIYNAIAGRRRDRDDLGDQIAGLSRGIADLARQVGELGRRTLGLEARGDAVADRIHNATRPLAAEVAELGALVRQLAESVAGHDAALANSTPAAAPSAGAVPARPATSTAAATEPLDLWPFMPAAQNDRRGQERMAAEIRSAIEANRIDLYLQPIVTLPQRKVRYYEALMQLRTEDGRTIEPDQFLEPAERSGLIARLEQMILTRCVQVLRRMQQNNRDIGLFCNLSAVTLNDAQVFSQISQFLDANRVLAPGLFLEFKQTAWRAMGPLELEALAGLYTLGFRFGMNHVADIRIEPRDLADRGIRFVKVPAALLLGRVGSAAATDIHVADLSDLLSRHSISLLADNIESETEVVDLLDYELKFGQGNLFSPPRPVRAHMAQGGAEASDAPAAEARADPSPARATPARRGGLMTG